MLYFAYGSNMDWPRMKSRCPFASFVGIAILPGHRVAFTRESLEGYGVAGLVQETGHDVWGVVYKICDHDVGLLDKAEGYQPGRDSNAYWRREWMVFLDGDQGRPLTVFTYFAEPSHRPPLPSQEYKEHILSGARFWHLPTQYIAELEGIKAANAATGSRSEAGGDN